MADDPPWAFVPMRCDGAAHIDSHYDAYAECARPCLGCPDYTWTYQGSNCAKEQYNSTTPTPCCPVPQQAWRSYHPEVWRCVSVQCAESEPGQGNYQSHEVAQAVLTQFGKFCAEDMKEPLYEYWKGSHFHGGYEMRGFDFEPLLDPEVAVSGYYGWGVLAAWHLGLLAAVIAGLRYTPYSKPPTVTETTRFWTLSNMYAMYAQIAHEARWLWHTDTELILSVVVVWIAIGDILLRGDKLSPMDVLVWPRIDAVPPGYNPILATHLLTVRAAMGVLDSFISVAVSIIFTSWLTRPSPGWWPLSSRRLHFRVLVTLVTAVAGIAVTAKRGICPESTKGICTPKSLLNTVISTRALQDLGHLSIADGQPRALMHFVRGHWVPWTLNDSYSEYRSLQELFMVFGGLAASIWTMIIYFYSNSPSSFFRRLLAAGQYDFVILKGIYITLAIMGHLLFIFLASFLPSIILLCCFLTFFYLLQVLFGLKTLLGPSPNVSFKELDQILAIVVGVITAIISICGSVFSFLHYRSDRGKFRIISC